MDHSAPSWTADALLEHGNFVRRLARSLVADEHEAEELAQEAWLIALKKAPTRGEGLRPWLARVLQGLAFTRRRSELRRLARDHRPRPAADTPAADRESEKLELQQRVVAAVLALPRPQKDVILLRYYRGLSLADTARQVGAPVETVRTRIKRAHEMLRVSLDRDYGDRSLWCGLLLAFGEVRPAPLGFLGAGVVGGVIMSWKGLVAAAAFVAVAAIVWGVRGENGLSGGAEQHVRLEQPGELPVVEPVVEDRRVADENSAWVDAAVGEPDGDRAAAPAPGVWLVGQLLEDGVETDAPARILVDTGRRWQFYDTVDRKSRAILPEPATAEIPVGQPFELDLTQIFERGEMTRRFTLVGDKKAPMFDPEVPLTGLRVFVDHDRFLPFDTSLQLDPRLAERARNGARVEIEAEFRLRKAAAVVEGRVTLPPGVDERLIHVRLVEFLRGVPRPGNDRATTCDAQGRFRLCVGSAGRQALVAWGNENVGTALRPETRILDLEEGEHRVLPPIVLTEGEVISGRVSFANGENTGGEVDARITGWEGYRYQFRADSSWLLMVWVDEVFELLHAAVPVDDQGRFVITGLGNRDYSLRFSSSRRQFYGQTAKEERNGVPVFRCESASAPGASTGEDLVRAPAAGVVLESQIGFAGFQVLGGGEPLPRVTLQVLWTSEADDSFRSVEQLRTDDQGRVLFALERHHPIDGRVVFVAPGWAPRDLASLAERLSDSDALQALELEEIMDPVHLWIHLEHTDGQPVEGLAVYLRPWPEGETRPDRDGTAFDLSSRRLFYRPRREGGVHHIDRIQSGRYWCTLAYGHTSTGPPPFSDSSFELVIPAGPDYHLERQVGPGGHVRVWAEDPGYADRLLIETFDADGLEIRAVLIPTDGAAFQTVEGLDAGDYVLHVEATGYEPQQLPFTVRHGKVTEIEVELVREQR